MRDVIWTIIVVWVIYRIYEAIKSSRVYIYQRHEHNHTYNTPKEGEVKIDAKQEASHHTDRKPNSDKGGEYVDFEEVKD
jgi:hypothetical protein